MSFKYILAIETSCDDTSVAIVGHRGWVTAMVSANQDLAHAPFGGVVPEVASRNHSRHLLPLIEKCLEQAELKLSDISGLAVTNRPGLVGSLIVGLVTVKSMALHTELPFVGVNHLEGHIFAPFLRDKEYEPGYPLSFPFVALAVSGGHTTVYEVRGLGDYRILGSTVDDAAGEAFDKFAKMLGLGFPGGAQVDLLARQGNPGAYEFPRPMIRESGCRMSFSGIKAAAERLLQKMSAEEIASKKTDLCASFQKAVVDVLIVKSKEGLKQVNTDRLIITGGVSANSGLRQEAQALAEASGLKLFIPPLRYCTDNAAMIGWVGLMRLERGERDNLSLGPSPRPYPGDFS